MLICHLNKNLISSEKVDDHLVRLRQTIDWILNARFKSFLPKCHFKRTKAKGLGRAVTAESLMPKKICCQKHSGLGFLPKREPSSFFMCAKFCSGVLRDSVAKVVLMMILIRKALKMQGFQDFHRVFEQKERSVKLSSLGLCTAN